MAGTVGGKKPLSLKPKAAPITMDDIFGNQLGIDPDMRKAAEAKGLDLRWVNAKMIVDMAGYHPQGWRPVRRKELCATLGEDQHSKSFGIDPEGYIRRGDLVLGVRDKQLGDKHKSYLRQEAERVSIKRLQKAHAEELRQHLKETGEHVIEGDDEDEED